METNSSRSRASRHSRIRWSLGRPAYFFSQTASCLTNSSKTAPICKKHRVESVGVGTNIADASACREQKWIEQISVQLEEVYYQSAIFEPSRAKSERVIS